jgi:hypothetical protein
MLLMSLVQTFGSIDFCIAGESVSCPSASASLADSAAFADMPLNPSISASSNLMMLLLFILNS